MYSFICIWFMIVTMTYVFNLYLFLIMIVSEIKNKQTNKR